MTVIVPAHLTPKTPAKKSVSKEEMEKLRKEDNKLVKGVFRCHEPRGGSVTMVYKEYKGDPVRRFVMHDGQQYEIPYGLAKMINRECGYYIHGHVLDENGNSLVDKKNKWISRMNFESTAFYG